MIDALLQALGSDQVITQSDELALYDDDFSEVEPVLPKVVVLPTSVAQVQHIVRVASRFGASITPRVAGTNVAGLTVPAPDSLVVDFRRMNRIVQLFEEDRVIVLEPGVTQQMLKDYLDGTGLPLDFGYSLGPKRSSVLANGLLDGLHNRSIKYGTMGQSVAGLQVVLADGSVAKTGAWALVDVPFARSPFPDLTGLFVGWQATTGLVTKGAFHLAPKHPYTERWFVLAYSIHGTFEAMRRLSRMEFCDDVGGLSWPTAKMMLGVQRPHPVPDPGEPQFFLYVDLTAQTPEHMVLKREMMQRVIDDLRNEGQRYEQPIDVQTLVSLNPSMDKFASFPTDLDFLMDHDGGGLTWVGTYGPLSRFDAAAYAGVGIMERNGIAPSIVSRSMKQGHFGVLRFLSTFDRSDASQIALIKKVNLELLREMTQRGFVMYKTPAWAMREMLPQMDPGFFALMTKVKRMMDPQGIFNPGKLLL